MKLLFRMDKEMNKDWTDAFREQSLSEKITLSPDGWLQIGRKMRRAKVVRRSALAAAILLPVSALLLWSPWHNSSISIKDYPFIAINDVPSRLEIAPVSQEDTPIFQKTSLAHTRNTPASRRSAPVISDVSPDTQDESTEAPVPSHVPDAKELEQTTDLGSFQVFSEPTIQGHHHFSFGVKAGSGTAHCNTIIQLHSIPYIAALMYLNTDPSIAPPVRSNAANMTPYEALANDHFPLLSTNNYIHDLPVSLGITARLDLTSRMGLESGLEYTYLHSTAESTDGRLDQRLHFIGIPLRLDARLVSFGGFDLYAGAGTKVEKCVAASLGVIRCEEKRLQWSAEAFAGIQYGLGDRMHVFFQPEVSYYLTETDLVTIRTDQPFTLTLHAGLRYDLPEK